MRVLLDNGAPRAIASALRGHTVEESRFLGWGDPKTGVLLDSAESAGFEDFVSTNKNIRYQQNLSKRKVAIVVLGRGRWHLIRPVMPQIVAAISSATPGTFVEITIPDQ